MPNTVDRNRRTHVEGLLPFVGKSVTIGTTDFHYVVGRFIELRPDDMLRLSVVGREVLIPRLGVATIQEANPATAEFVK